MSVLALQRLQVRHPASRGDGYALDGVSLRIETGEAVAVIGPSGAGKTTLLHAIACALKPQSGAVQLLGQNPWALSRSELRRLRARLFLAPQTPPLPPRQRVVTAVLAGRLPAQGLWASVRSLVIPSAIPVAHAALERFALADKLFDRVDRLSGGERQRVGLARVLVSGAELLLVDEPLSALDPTRASLSIDALLGAARERGATLVCSLHQVEVARSRFVRVIALRGGRIAFDCASADVSDEMLRQLYADYEHELVGPAYPDAPVSPSLDEPEAEVARPVTVAER